MRLRHLGWHLHHLGYLGWQLHMGWQLHRLDRCRRQQHVQLLVLLLLLLLLLQLKNLHQLPLCRLLLLEQLKSLLQRIFWPCQAAAEQLQKEEKLHHCCSRTGSYSSSCRDRSS